MPVTMACLQETLRKYTVVPLVTRIANRDTKLCNYDVPKGTKVALHLHGTHNMWKDPGSYQPDRFLPGGEFEQFPEDIRRCLHQDVRIIHTFLLKCPMFVQYVIAGQRRPLPCECASAARQKNGR
jgi:Cytochrome P450